jgi:hypothetical protein
MQRQLRTLALLVLGSGCATLPKGDVEELKPAAEKFHERIRWKDFRGAAELVIPELSMNFVRSRLASNDEKDLFITDFQLEDAQVAPNMLEASVVSRISWYRLPSTTEKSEIVTSLLVWREGQWLLERQDSGPFVELSAPKK